MNNYLTMLIRQYNKLFFCLILLLGFVLRIYGLDKYSFWYDEALSAYMSRIQLSFGEIIKYSSYDTQPLFYEILHFWRYLGDNEVTLRLLPLLFGVFSIVLIYKIGTILFGKKVGLLSSFILSVSPFHIFYSQELRIFTMVVFFTLMSIYYLIKLLQKFNLFYSILFIVFTTLCLYFYDTTLFLVIAENIFLIVFYRKEEKIIKKWFFIQFIIFLLYSPWFITVVIERFLNYKSAGFIIWVPKVNFKTTIQTISIFNLGYNANYRLSQFGFLLFFTLFIIGIGHIFRERKKIFLLSFWLFTPIVTIALITKVINLFLPRALIYISPAYYILIAKGISRIKKKSILLFILVMVATLSFSSLKNYYHNIYPLSEYPYRIGVHPKIENKIATEYVEQHYANGDVITHTSRCTSQSFIYYQNKQLENRFIFLNVKDLLPEYKYIFQEPYYGLMKSFGLSPINIKELIRGYKRIWLVVSEWEVAWSLSIQNPRAKIIKEWLDNNCTLINQKDFLGIQIYLYKT